jgi:hypothetical protein
MLCVSYIYVNIICSHSLIRIKVNNKVTRSGATLVEFEYTHLNSRMRIWRGEGVRCCGGLVRLRVNLVIDFGQILASAMSNNYFSCYKT